MVYPIKNYTRTFANTDSRQNYKYIPMAVYTDGTWGQARVVLAQNNDAGYTARVFNCDENEALSVIIAWFSGTVDALWSYKFYAAALASGETLTWNLINGTNYNLDNTNASKLHYLTYNITSGSWENGDMIRIAINNNEANNISFLSGYLRGTMEYDTT